MKLPIIVIDDNKSIYDDFCKILLSNFRSSELDSMEDLLFDEPSQSHKPEKEYTIDYASQGEEGYKKIVEAQSNGRPYHLAFCDMRMPPGWDGLKTLEYITHEEKNIQLVICTAFSDHSFEEINNRLGNSANILILKKPFDPIEVRQIANSLTEKWSLNQKANLIMSELEVMVKDRTSELENSKEKIRAINQGLEAEVAKRTEDLLIAKQQAETANIAKSQFLATISHELRTPLHGILSFSNFGITKAETASSEKKLSYFTKIHKCGSNLLKLVNALLDLAKIESGKMTYNIESRNFNSLFDEVQSEFSAICEDRQLQIETMCSGSLVEINVDPEKIQQVLRNLVSNAIKFAPDNTTITIGSDYSEDKLTVTVTDCGIGIPDGELVHIFDKFSQASTIKEATGGTGLGLAICRQIIDAHHGEIWAENHKEGGAKFTFVLPNRLEVQKAS